MTVNLKQLKPFAHGGNRCCYVDPRDESRCIKVRRPEFTLEDLRRKKGFPKSLKPLSAFDESLKEFAIMQQIDHSLGEPVYRILSRTFGFIETDMGQGLCSELIRNEDGKISWSVMQYIWELGLTPSLEQALTHFEKDWSDFLIPTRDLLLHNVVAQCNSDKEVTRLVIIDGLNSPTLLPYSWLPRPFRQRRARLKFLKFKQLISDLLKVRETGKLPSDFWLQKHDGTESKS